MIHTTVIGKVDNSYTFTTMMQLIISTKFKMYFKQSHTSVHTVIVARKPVYLLLAGTTW